MLVNGLQLRGKVFPPEGDPLETVIEYRDSAALQMFRNFFHILPSLPGE